MEGWEDSSYSTRLFSSNVPMADYRILTPWGIILNWIVRSFVHGYRQLLYLLIPGDCEDSRHWNTPESSLSRHRKAFRRFLFCLEVYQFLESSGDNLNSNSWEICSGAKIMLKACIKRLSWNLSNAKPGLRLPTSSTAPLLFHTPNVTEEGNATSNIPSGKCQMHRLSILE
jgi:hypothetical protein